MPNGRIVMRKKDGSLKVRVRQLIPAEIRAAHAVALAAKVAREPPGVLAYSQWLNEAEARDAFLTEQEMRQMPIGTVLEVVEADLTRFYVYQAYHQGIPRNVPFDPVQFFKKVCPFRAKTLRILAQYPEQEEEASFRVRYEGKEDEEDQEDEKERSLYVDDNWIVNGGSGDGYSRFITRARLAEMPPFFFRDTPEGYYEHPLEPESEYETDPEAVVGPDERVDVERFGFGDWAYEPGDEGDEGDEGIECELIRVR